MRGRKLIFLLPISGLGQQLEGTCETAMHTMVFHREKMHEYQCRKFLAEEIVEEGRNLQKRDGTLLLDQGSSKYTDWLARSSTLEDIYRHYEQDAAADAPVGSSIPSESYPPIGGYGGGYDGDVTGYAMLGNKVSQADSTGYGVGTSYGVPHYGGGGGGGGGGTITLTKSDKGMKLQDLFQLALTAIAFLAFGTFIIEVIMCIMGVELKDKEIEIVMMTPNEPLMQGNNYFKSDERRRARSLQQFLIMQTLEAMAEKATSSLNALQHISSDDGHRLQQVLCSTASLSRVFNGTSRLWPPLWSFGMSWVGGRHSGTLKYLTATVRGLAGTDCFSDVTT